MKQASSYAITHGTRYVALFNWDSLVLCYVSQLDVTQDLDTRVDNGIGEYCDIDIINFKDSHKMRLVLLGFLAEACRDTP